MPRSRKKACWSHSVGVYGSRVRVSELAPGGNLYLLWVERRAGQRKRCLGHRDRKRGKEQALAFARDLAENRDGIETERLTIQRLFDIYEAEGLHGRSVKHRAEVARKLRLWLGFLGGGRAVETLNPADVDRFVAERKAGLLRPAGRLAMAPVEMTTIWHDFVALNTALNFAVRHRRDNGHALLVANPLISVRLSKTVNPTRPVADASYYHDLRAVADGVNARFALAVDLAHSTGHRIDAILKLRWDDISFQPTSFAPLGTIRWRAENDKMDNDHAVPMDKVASTALHRVFVQRPAIGPVWVFPSSSDDARPVDRHLANRWLRRAEKMAGVDHVRGRGWHAFRRGWASARKHLPDVDVAAAGGWKDTATMKRCYQKADAAGVLRVVQNLSDPAALSNTGE